MRIKAGLARITRAFVTYPKVTLLLVLLVTLVMLGNTRHFRLDASSDTLIDKNDYTLQLTESVNKEFGFNDFLIIGYQPKTGHLFDQYYLDQLAMLQSRLSTVSGVSEVISILDLPVFPDQPASLAAAMSSLVLFRDTGLTGNAARQLFENHPIYTDFIVGPDLESSALLLILSPDLSVNISNEAAGEINKQLLQDIRKVLEPYDTRVNLYISGIRMITHDVIAFIKRDLSLFGGVSLILLMLTLWLIFRQVRSIAFPIITCALSIIIMIGLFGMLRWDVTVISSNFVSVQLILNLALCLHLMIKYRQLADDHPDASPVDLACMTVETKLYPCLFASMTTIAGFASLAISDILSVTTFGLMMIVGVCISFLTTFIVFPAFMSLLKRPVNRALSQYGIASLVPLSERLVKHYPQSIIIGSVLLLIISGIGVNKLVVENRFIDYFRSSTDIHKGLSYIDKNLGGTVPLNIVITFDSDDATDTITDSDFDDFFDEPDAFNQSSWFTPNRIAIINKAQQYLSNQSETGKVLSLGTLLDFAAMLNKGPLDTLAISILYESIDPEWRNLLIDSFISQSANQARFWIRMRDQNPDLKRDAFIKRIKSDLPRHLGLRPDQISYSGPMILYNNMLQKLFSSQISTLGVVLLVLFLMFWVLFRSAKIAIIAIIPNFLAVISILGLMGWWGIPLDLMTITLASIAIGIAVDDTIHYIYKFKAVYAETGDYTHALHNTHQSIGRVLVYTSVVIIIGFMVLVLSTFMPSVYFGLLTSLAMFLALLLTLTLLPQLLMRIRPF